MQRPDWCPGDVWHEAERQLVISDLAQLRRPEFDRAIPVVAQAILAERERCVKVVEEQVPAWVKGRDGEYWEGYREAIADALDDLRIPAGAREGAAD